MSAPDPFAPGDSGGKSIAAPNAAVDVDLALTLPLRGVELIEASAGTGKTYTLAGIYTRLIVERRLSVRQILVVTFTKAATEELKSRLRARLVLCAEVAAGLHGDVGKVSSELRQCRALVATALIEEDARILQSRLRLASLELDTAQISTIHGFCQRALREHALDASAAAEGELVASDRDLLEIIAADLWRARAVANDVEAFDALASVVGDAKHFAQLLPRLLDVRGELLPLPTQGEAQARATMRAAEVANRRLVTAWLDCGASAFAALAEHARAGHVNATSYPLKKIELHTELFSRTFNDARIPDSELLQRYTTQTLNSSKCIKKNKMQLPRQGFFDAIAITVEAQQQAHIARQQLGLHLLRENLLAAQHRLEAIKREARRFSYDDLIQHLHAALHGAQGDALAQALREQYPAALVDEFQDTDVLQFAIFAAIYAVGATRSRDDAATALILIGDPKQAIYRFRGGDVHTYLAARQRADHHSLRQNFRSTPRYLRALDHLYTFADTAAFADPRIRFESVVSGGGTTDADLLIDGLPATPLTFWLDSEGDAINKTDATARLAQGCAAGIFDLLQHARDGRALIRDQKSSGAARVHRGLEPRDLAVLVSTNDEAIAMQLALSALHIPSVSLSKRSVFASDEAQELHLLLDALIEFDESRLRAAMTTLLLGYTLADFAALATEPQRWNDALHVFEKSRESWATHGVLAMLEFLFERRAGALLALQGGERRLTNWLQLADLAQAASGQVLGQRGLADWLAQRIKQVDDDNEDEQLRLESDADRVQVRTLHASKGLEYPIVFLPFAALRRSESTKTPRLISMRRDDGSAASYLICDKDAADVPQARDARTREQADDLAERLRVLYVGLTRARCACFIAAGIFGKGDTPALLHLLRVDEADNAAANLSQRLHELIAQAFAADGRGSIVLAPLPEPTAQRWRSAEKNSPGPARVVTRHLRELRSVYSFSRLSAGARDGERTEERTGNDDEQGRVDESATQLIAVPSALRGPRFGTAFHEILEHAEFALWRDWRSSTAPLDQQDLIDNTLRRHALIDAGAGSNTIRQAVTQLIAATLNAPMPFGARLADLDVTDMRTELPFHFAIEQTDTMRWLQQMQQYAYLRERARFALDANRLAGLMTGVLDLVVHYRGQWWVIDYKTNLLGAADGSRSHTSNPYTPPRLAQAVRQGEYDLQYLIYLVALHRWLKSRLGARYDYTRDIGGALYLFVRGLDANGVNGVHHDCPPVELIESLDDLLRARRTA